MGGCIPHHRGGDTADRGADDCFDSRVFDGVRGAGSHGCAFEARFGADVGEVFVELSVADEFVAAGGVESGVGVGRTFDFAAEFGEVREDPGGTNGAGDRRRIDGEGGE